MRELVHFSSLHFAVKLDLIAALIRADELWLFLGLGLSRLEKALEVLHLPLLLVDLIFLLECFSNKFL